MMGCFILKAMDNGRKTRMDGMVHWVGVADDLPAFFQGYGWGKG
jgi:hypothetical protein